MYKLNLRIITKNHSADPKIRFQLIKNKNFKNKIDYKADNGHADNVGVQIIINIRINK